MIDNIYYKEDDLPVSCSLQNLRKVAPHYHDKSVVLVYVLNGKVEIKAGKLHAEIKEGELAFINKEEVHYLIGDTKNVVLVVHVNTSGKYFKASQIYNADKLTTLKLDLLTLTYCYHMDELVEEDVYMSKCRQIVQWVDENFSLKENPVIEFLNNNYRKVLNADVTASEFGIGRRSLTNLMKREGFGGFMEYLKFLRCRTADKMILESGMQIRKIADLAGFTSERSFIRDYTDYAEKTPLQQHKFYKELSKYSLYKMKDFPSKYVLSLIREHVGDMILKKSLYDVRKDVV